MLSAKVRRETQATSIGVGKAASTSVVVENNDTRIDGRWHIVGRRQETDFPPGYRPAE